MLQIFSFPGQFAHMRKLNSIDLILEIILTVLVAVWMLFGQIALFSLWKILSFTKAGMFFTQVSLRWLRNLLHACQSAVVIPVLLFLLIAPQADDPGALVMLTAVGLFLFTLALLLSILIEQIESKIPETLG
jgi:hypothetical protein